MSATPLQSLFPFLPTKYCLSITAIISSRQRPPRNNSTVRGCSVSENCCSAASCPLGTLPRLASLHDHNHLTFIATAMTCFI
ncbi:hypothetical protein DUNSADRAFT_17769 [Dunaliella salina]|uniref:Uncharacterized protein n=1 Tax=Dunaliella salina TaxID=3046 RepID=A0ABQ7G149_DUNSA|nr:hypothetical protein DUNSADRAFT_17769 [Dunaliella salina]|eukprot:KAF5828335.1 hypothetical protein DUNSADRAFT_17769 [Dunaliella salina]